MMSSNSKFAQLQILDVFFLLMEKQSDTVIPLNVQAHVRHFCFLLKMQNYLTREKQI